MSISIHAPRAGGDYYEVTYNGDKNISIHAPRAGGDVSGSRSLCRLKAFQSTPPVRGATG